MLAELKRVVESSSPLPSFRPPSASMISKSEPSGQRAQVDKESDRRVQATPDNSAKSGQPTVSRKATTPTARSLKLAAGGLAPAGVAMIGVTFAIINRAPDLSKRELAVVATEGPARPQSGEQTVEPSNSVGPLIQDSRPTEPSQVGALESRLGAITAPEGNTSLPPGGWAVADAPPQPASFGLESVAPTFLPAPADPAPALVAQQTASQDGPPTATAPSAPASTGSALPAETPKPHANAPATAYVSTEAARPSTPKSIQRGNLPGNRPTKASQACKSPVKTSCSG
jgi:hypothetical protein